MPCVKILLGTPLGADSADVHVGSAQYRARKIHDMVNQHDDRLRHVVALARREALSLSHSVLKPEEYGGQLQRSSFTAYAVDYNRDTYRLSRASGHRAGVHSEQILWERDAIRIDRIRDDDCCS
eukprot:COSAG02_NODE_603_length_19693_cov_3.883944_2_plen_124_part_00